jgi:hypothetical protein
MHICLTSVILREDECDWHTETKISLHPVRSESYDVHTIPSLKYSYVGCLTQK